MDSYMCSVCGFIYNEETAECDREGNPIPFSEVDYDWSCPNCGASPDLFQRVEESPEYPSPKKI